MRKTNWRVAGMEINHHECGECEAEIIIRGDYTSYWMSALMASPINLANEIEAKLNGPKTSFEIKKVIYSGPATIVLWKDGTKTVVKCQEGDEFDKEKGLAMAISKKALGNTGSYFDEIKKWTEPQVEFVSAVVDVWSELIAKYGQLLK